MARGTFDVKVLPLDHHDTAPGSTLGRFSIDKTWAGDLVGTSVGEMLAGGSAKGSGAYVAIERISGTLDGREGSFMLVHRGLMTDNVPSLDIGIVPGSGTGGLEGISGSFTLTIEGKEHRWEMEYSLT